MLSVPPPSHPFPPPHSRPHPHLPSQLQRGGVLPPGPQTGVRPLGAKVQGAPPAQDARAVSGTLSLWLDRQLSNARGTVLRVPQGCMWLSGGVARCVAGCFVLRVVLLFVLLFSGCVAACHGLCCCESQLVTAMLSVLLSVLQVVLLFVLPVAMVEHLTRIVTFSR